MPKTANDNQKNKNKAEQGRNRGAGIARSAARSAKEQAWG